MDQGVPSFTRINPVDSLLAIEIFQTSYTMRKTVFILILLVYIFSSTAYAQTDKPAYLLYDKNGDLISYENLIDFSHQHDIIFFGEQHNNAIAHWLQFELIEELSEDGMKSLLVGMEMFEADQQILIDEYLEGKISQNSFENEARLWNNYKTDYKPIVEYAKENNIPVVATNIPRRYASTVYHKGLSAIDSLSTDAKKWIAPLPVDVDTTLQSYRNMSQMAHGHGGENLIYSQAIKDATMAHFILSNMDSSSRMVHLNGSYHSNDYEGIVWYIKKEATDMKILTINTISAENIENVQPDRLQSADITLAVPLSMTKTH